MMRSLFRGSFFSSLEGAIWRIVLQHAAASQESLLFEPISTVQHRLQYQPLCTNALS